MDSVRRGARHPVVQNRAVEVVVVASRFGGVLGELGNMLVSSLVRIGAPSALLTGRDPGVADADRVLLLGAGVEFDDALAGLEVKRRRADVTLWALDPFPPPDLGVRAMALGLAAGRRVNGMRRMERRVGAPTGEAGRFGRTKRAARAAAVRIAAGGRATSAELAFAFERLAWVSSAHAAGQLQRVFASSPASVRVLESNGVPASYVAVPYDEAMGVDLGCERDLDVVFLGSSLDRRRSRLSHLSSALASRGVELTVVDAGCFGEDRTALLNRARISVNLHKFPWHLERTRLHLSMACGAAVVSELPLADPAPFEMGTHLEAAAFDDLAAAIVTLLEDDEHRRRLVEAATRLLRAGPSMDSIATMLMSG